MSSHSKFSKYPAEVICEMHPLFRGLLWVAAARSTDETRAVLNTILIENDGGLWRIVATDGRRIHVHTFDPGLFDTDIDLLEPGLYEVVAKSTKFIVLAESEIGQKYPNWRQAIPLYEPQFSDGVDSRTISRIGIATGVLLANDYLSDAIGFGHGRKRDARVVTEFGANPINPRGVFLVRHDLGVAGLMPMREPEQDETSEATPDPDQTTFGFGDAVPVEAVALIGHSPMDGGNYLTDAADEAE